MNCKRESCVRTGLSFGFNLQLGLKHFETVRAPLLLTARKRPVQEMQMQNTARHRQLLRCPALSHGNAAPSQENTVLGHEHTLTALPLRGRRVLFSPAISQQVPLPTAAVLPAPGQQPALILLPPGGGGEAIQGLNCGKDERRFCYHSPQSISYLAVHQRSR